MIKIQQVLSVIFPSHCFHCFCTISYGLFCQNCATKINNGFHLDINNSPIDSFSARYIYEGGIRNVIDKWKYLPSPKLGNEFIKFSLTSDWLRANIPQRPDAIVTIPPHKMHLRERGFDPVFDFGQFLSKTLDIEIHGVLRRTSTQIPQTQSSDSERMNNVRGKFTIQLSPRDHVLLVDDVSTTGSTLLEAATILSKAGTKRIDCIVLATSKNKLSFLKEVHQ